MPASMPARPSQAEWERRAVEQLSARKAEKDKAEAERRIIIGGTDCTDNIRELLACAPPLTEEASALIAIFFRDPDPRPDEWPATPRLSGRAVNPKAGSLYAAHLRASDGICDRCRKEGRREVDHCHEHGVVRGLICRNCNNLDDDNMGSPYRNNCGFCEWELWLQRRLSR